MEGKTFKRKKVLINKPLQYKFMARVFVTIFLLIFLSLTAVLYLNSKELFKQSTTIKNNVGILSKLSASQKSILSLNVTKDNMRANVIKIFIFTTILSLLIVVTIFLRLSHRYAGPIYRFEKTLDDIRSGNLGVKIHLRDKDEMKELAMAFNNMSKELNARMNDIQGSISQIENKISAETNSEEIVKKMKDLENKIKFFKITYN